MAVSLASVPLLVKKDLVRRSPGVSDAIFFASAACGSVTNTVETCCRVSTWAWMARFTRSFRSEGFGQAVARCERRDLLRQRGLRLGDEHGGDVLQGVHLGVDGAIHTVVAVAHTDGEDATEEIQIRASGGVVDELVFGARDYERLAVVMEDCRKQVFLAGE